MNVALWLSGSAALPLRMVAGVTAVWLFAGLAALLLGRFSAALRHRLWSLTMLAALVTPVAALLLPELRLGWMHPRDHVAGHVARPLPVLTTENSVSPEPPVRPSPLGAAPPGAFSSNAPETSSPHSTNLPTESIGARASSPAAGPDYLWLVVFLVPLLWQLIRIVRSLAITRGLVRRAQPLKDARATKLLALWCQRVGWRSEVRLLASAETNVPLCAGLWRPRVILPADWRDWTGDALSAALGHELAHAARRDVAWQLLARLACAIYWFHPLAYLAAWRMRVERETACDDVVLAAGQHPAAYARVLLDLASRLSVERTQSLALPMAARAGLEQRVRAILAGSRARSPVTRAAGLLLLAAMFLAVLAVGSLSPLAPEITSSAVAAGGEQPATPKSNNDPITTKDAKKAKAEEKDTVEVLGDVVDEAGKPVPNITVTLISDSQSRPTTRSSADGKFSIRVARTKVRFLTLVARSDDGRRQGFVLYLGDTKLPTRERIVLGKSREIVVTVLDAEKRPVAEALVAATSWHSKIIDAKSDRNGKAVLVVPAEMPLQYVYALKPDVGLDYFMYRLKDQPVSDPHQLAPDHNKPLILTLTGVRVVRARVVDEKKQPLAGVRVNPWYVELPNKGGIFNAVWSLEVTDLNGMAEFHTIPANNTKPVMFLARKEKYFAPERTMFDPAGAKNEVTSQLFPQVRVHGIVKLADGKPAGGAVVAINGDGYAFNNNFHGEARSNAQGEFEQYVNSDVCYLFSAARDRQISKAELRVVLAGKETPPVELELEPATRVFGTLFSTDSKPLKGEYLTMYCRDGEDYYKLPKEQQLPNPAGLGKGLSPRVSYNATTDDEGHFEFFAGRGNYYVIGNNLQKNASRFELTGQKELQLRLEVDLPPDIELSGKVVLASDMKQVVAKADVTAVPIINDVHSPGSAKGFAAISDAAGAFKVRRSSAELLVTARSVDGRLGALVTLSADAKEMEIPLVPTASARGRLVDSDTGKPLAGQRIEYVFELKYANGGGGTFFYGVFSGSTTSDARGDFTLTGLLVGGDYSLQFVGPADRAERERVRVGSVKVERAEAIELGDVKGKAITSK